MGRRAKPTALKLVEGNPGKRPLNTKEPTPKNMLAKKDAPKTMGMVGKIIWVKVLKEAPDGMLSSLDFAELERFCNAYEYYNSAKDKVDTIGLVVMLPNGTEVPNAFLQVMNKQGEIMSSAASKLGLTPADRQRLKIDTNEAPKTDPFSKFFNNDV